MRDFCTIPEYLPYADRLDETRPYHSIVALVQCEPQHWAMEEPFYRHDRIGRLGGIATGYSRALEYSTIAPLTAWEILAYLEHDLPGATLRTELEKLGNQGKQSRGVIVETCLDILAGREPNPDLFPESAIRKYRALATLYFAEEAGAVMYVWLMHLARLECGKSESEPEEIADISDDLEIHL